MTKRHHEMTDTTDIYYHYTTREALKSILTYGLLPCPVECWREDWSERCDGDGVTYIDGFPPDFPVVWLTKLLLDSTPTRDVRIKIELLPNRKHLVHLPKWLKRHAPDTFAKLDADITFTGWLQHYWFKGIITPNKFRGIDAITAVEMAGSRRRTEENIPWNTKI
jgi:hypothetical protein